MGAFPAVEDAKEYGTHCGGKRGGGQNADLRPTEQGVIVESEVRDEQRQSEADSGEGRCGSDMGQVETRAEGAGADPASDGGRSRDSGSFTEDETHDHSPGEP